uniref:Uncharacterized protein n=1 Tax=Chromera velia CCMP2878 TaxID=1169474 RepID=A0A0G4HYM6_9ALVE|eukprot:Cvel_9511.t1-p1 / transcript=Cvel_9511.t1 / gene=Cvel_9511 / organism=Chromera_velia_CCMP2878 / gene_product=hypothetical protein / transcript_product=hypothetical protein / location=Cvel_scaffold550:18614-31311(-) / protein_length=2322 / sequence_SO=supercontig / SO=protein_coding / is_pseudo=false
MQEDHDQAEKENENNPEPPQLLRKSGTGNEERSGSPEVPLFPPMTSQQSSSSSYAAPAGPESESRNEEGAVEKKWKEEDQTAEKGEKKIQSPPSPSPSLSPLAQTDAKVQGFVATSMSEMGDKLTTQRAPAETETKRRETEKENHPSNPPPDHNRRQEDRENLKEKADEVSSDEEADPFCPRELKILPRGAAVSRPWRHQAEPRHLKGGEGEGRERERAFPLFSLKKALAPYRTHSDVRLDARVAAVAPEEEKEKDEPEKEEEGGKGKEKEKEVSDKEKEKGGVHTQSQNNKEREKDKDRTRVDISKMEQEYREKNQVVDSLTACVNSLLARISKTGLVGHPESTCFRVAREKQRRREDHDERGGGLVADGGGDGLPDRKKHKQKKAQAVPPPAARRDFFYEEDGWLDDSGVLSDFGIDSEDEREDLDRDLEGYTSTSSSSAASASDSEGGGSGSDGDGDSEEKERETDGESEADMARALFSSFRCVAESSESSGTEGEREREERRRKRRKEGMERREEESEDEEEDERVWQIEKTKIPFKDNQEWADCFETLEDKCMNATNQEAQKRKVKDALDEIWDSLYKEPDQGSLKVSARDYAKEVLGQTKEGTARFEKLMERLCDCCKDLAPRMTRKNFCTWWRVLCYQRLITTVIEQEEEPRYLEAIAKSVTGPEEGEGGKFRSALKQAIKNFKQLSKQKEKERQVSSSSSSSSSGPAKEPEEKKENEKEKEKNLLAPPSPFPLSSSNAEKEKEGQNAMLSFMSPPMRSSAGSHLVASTPPHARIGRSPSLLLRWAFASAEPRAGPPMPGASPSSVLLARRQSQGEAEGEGQARRSQQQKDPEEEGKPREEEIEEAPGLGPGQPKKNPIIMCLSPVPEERERDMEEHTHRDLKREREREGGSREAPLEPSGDSDGDVDMEPVDGCKDGNQERSREPSHPSSERGSGAGTPGGPPRRFPRVLQQLHQQQQEEEERERVGKSTATTPVRRDRGEPGSLHFHPHPHPNPLPPPSRAESVQSRSDAAAPQPQSTFAADRDPFLSVALALGEEEGGEGEGGMGALCGGEEEGEGPSEEEAVALTLFEGKRAEWFSFLASSKEHQERWQKAKAAAPAEEEEQSLWELTVLAWCVRAFPQCRATGNPPCSLPLPPPFPVTDPQQQLAGEGEKEDEKMSSVPVPHATERAPAASSSSSASGGGVGSSVDADVGMAAAEGEAGVQPAEDDTVREYGGDVLMGEPAEPNGDGQVVPILVLQPSVSPPSSSSDSAGRRAPIQANKEEPPEGKKEGDPQVEHAAPRVGTQAKQEEEEAEREGGGLRLRLTKDCAQSAEEGGKEGDKQASAPLPEVGVGAGGKETAKKKPTTPSIFPQEWAETLCRWESLHKLRMQAIAELRKVNPNRGRELEEKFEKEFYIFLAKRLKRMLVDHPAYRLEWEHLRIPFNMIREHLKLMRLEMGPRTVPKKPAPEMSKAAKNRNEEEHRHLKAKREKIRNNAKARAKSRGSSKSGTPGGTGAGSGRSLGGMINVKGLPGVGAAGKGAAAGGAGGTCGGETKTASCGGHLLCNREKERERVTEKIYWFEKNVPKRALPGALPRNRLTLPVTFVVFVRRDGVGGGDCGEKREGGEKELLKSAEPSKLSELQEVKVVLHNHPYQLPGFATRAPHKWRLCVNDADVVQRAKAQLKAGLHTAAFWGFPPQASPHSSDQLTFSSPEACLRCLASLFPCRLFDPPSDAFLPAPPPREEKKGQAKEMEQPAAQSQTEKEKKKAGRAKAIQIHPPRPCSLIPLNPFEAPPGVPPAPMQTETETEGGSAAGDSGETEGEGRQEGKGQERGGEGGEKEDATSAEVNPETERATEEASERQKNACMRLLKMRVLDPRTGSDRLFSLLDILTLAFVRDEEDKANSRAFLLLQTGTELASSSSSCSSPAETNGDQQNFRKCGQMVEAFPFFSGGWVKFQLPPTETERTKAGISQNRNFAHHQKQAAGASHPVSAASVNPMPLHRPVPPSTLMKPSPAPSMEPEIEPSGEHPVSLPLHHFSAAPAALHRGKGTGRETARAPPPHTATGVAKPPLAHRRPPNPIPTPNLNTAAPSSAFALNPARSVLPPHSSVMPPSAVRDLGGRLGFSEAVPTGAPRVRPAGWGDIEVGGEIEKDNQNCKKRKASALASSSSSDAPQTVFGSVSAVPGGQRGREREREETAPFQSRSKILTVTSRGGGRGVGAALGAPRERNGGGDGGNLAAGVGGRTRTAPLPSSLLGGSGAGGQLRGPGQPGQGRGASPPAQPPQARAPSVRLVTTRPDGQTVRGPWMTHITDPGLAEPPYEAWQFARRPG